MTTFKKSTDNMTEKEAYWVWTQGGLNEYITATSRHEAVRIFLRNRQVALDKRIYVVAAKDVEKWRIGMSLDRS